MIKPEEKAKVGHFYASIGERIKAARLRKGVKQEGLAIYLNMTRASIVNIEKGRHHVSLFLLYQIAHHLEVDILEFLISMDQYLLDYTKVVSGEKRVDETVVGLPELFLTNPDSKDLMIDKLEKFLKAIKK